MLVELTIHGVAAGGANGDDRSLILLREKGGERMLPVVMSRRRAMILLSRDRLHLPIPFPVSIADAFNMLLTQFDVHMKHVEISAVKDGHIYCNVVAERDGEPHVVNFCQAHDGLVIAVTCCCPIVIDSDLLDAQYMHKVNDETFAMNINTLSRKMLEEALESAIRAEHYETASFLRDELRKRDNGKLPTLDTLFPDSGDDGL